MKQKHPYPAWVEVDLAAVRHNYNEICKFLTKKFPKKKCPGVIGVVKADAYGHGMLKVAKTLNALGMSFFAVSDIPEAVILRRNGIKKKILLLEDINDSGLNDVIKYKLIPSISRIKSAEKLNKLAKKIKRKVDVHINIDTGMNRLGVLYSEADYVISEILNMPYLNINGLYTHFPVADIDMTFTKEQINKMKVLHSNLRDKGSAVPFMHAANSVGLSTYTTDVFNYVRPGLMLYGLYPDKKIKRKIKLSPVMSVKAKVVCLKRIDKGCGISYGHTYKAKKDIDIAVLSIGYSDAFPRILSNQGSVILEGCKCRIVGRVTMDQIMVDVSKIKSIKIGSVATILGYEKKVSISACDIAYQAGTINYEIVCNFGNRLPKIYK